VTSHIEARTQRWEDRYIVAAGLIVLSILATVLGGDHRIGRMIFVLIESATLFVIVHASGVSPRGIKIATFLMAFAIAGTMVSIGLDRESVGPAFVGAALAFAGPVVIVRRTRLHVKVDQNTIAASLCIYLLAGMFFAYVYAVVDAIEGQFFAQGAQASNFVNFVYFSFTTLTTLGYGDYTARTNLGHMLAITEALFGQLYLVIVVAVLVSNIGRRRVMQAELDARDADADDD
jgi:hypothetical protein